MKRAVFLSMLVGFLPIPCPAAGLLIPEGDFRTPLEITSHQVDVSISDRHAETHVEQVFHNPTDRTLEAIYVFPVPRETTLDEFAMRMNGQRVTGELVESDEACRVYESIVFQVCDPGLLEFMGGRLIRARVFPIPPRGTQRIDLTYSGLLPMDSGMIHYEYPLRTAARAAQVRDDFSVTVQLNSGKPLAAVYSPSHAVEVDRHGASAATVSFRQRGALLDEDFDLYYAFCAEPVGMSLMTHRTAGEDGYFLLLVSPIEPREEEPVLHPDITFVLDTSASMMEADKIGQARRAVLEGLRGLFPENRFNVVHFNTEVGTFRDSLVPAEATTVDEAIRFVQALEPRGQTDILPALLAALPADTAADRGHVVVFLTDGKPTVGETRREAIARAVHEANRSGSRLFTFGVGDDVDTHLLDLLSQENRGVSEYLKPRAEIEPQLSAFYRRIRHPVMCDPEIAIKGGGTYDRYPRRLMDLFAGQELTLVGRFRQGGPAGIRLQGKIEGKGEELRLECRFPETETANGFLPRLWAGRKIAHFLDEIRLEGETRPRREEVMALSREYGIMTPYTSYLITEGDTAEAARPAPRSVDPLNLGSVFRGRITASGLSRGESHGEYGMDLGDAWRSDSGAEAVAMAKNLRDLKDASRLETAGSSLRVVEGRTFALRNGVWVERSFESARSAKVVEVRFLSRAYLEILRRHRWLAPFLALGRDVIVECPGGFLKVSETSGAETVPLKALDELLKG